MKERKQYTREFKKDVVAMTQQPGVKIIDIARQLGIRPKLVYKWRQESREDGEHAFPGTGNQTPEQAELARLRRENAQLREEREILKKAMRVIVGE